MRLIHLFSSSCRTKDVGKLFSFTFVAIFLGSQCFADQNITTRPAQPLNLKVPEEPIKKSDDGYEDFESTRPRASDCEGTTVLTKINQFAKEIAKELDEDTRPDDNATIRPILNKKATDNIEGVKPMRIQGGIKFQIKLQD